MVLKGKSAIVTGAARGIGAAIAKQLAGEGARVALADINLAAAQETAGQIGPAAVAVSVDVSEAASVESMVAQVERTVASPDILVNSAGVSIICPFLECTQETWDKTININLKGVFNCCQAVLQRMVPRQQGTIINLSSQSGKSGNAQYAAYCASKFGIIGLTQSLAMEFAETGIRVNALCPGVVFTPLWESMLDDYARKRNLTPAEVKPYLESRIPLGRLCSERDVAEMAAFIASDKAAYITGQSINISGGAIMH